MKSILSSEKINLGHATRPLTLVNTYWTNKAASVCWPIHQKGIIVFWCSYKYKLNIHLLKISTSVCTFRETADHHSTARRTDGGHYWGSEGGRYLIALYISWTTLPCTLMCLYIRTGLYCYDVWPRIQELMWNTASIRFFYSRTWAKDHPEFLGHFTLTKVATLTCNPSFKTIFSMLQGQSYNTGYTVLNARFIMRSIICFVMYIIF